KEIAEGRPLAEVKGISYPTAGGIVHNPDRELIRNMDALPSVIDVYKRDLTVDNYAIGYLKQPYMSLYTGRGCPARCTFCLWPQTIGGHDYRVRSPQSVYEEMKRAKELFPQVKEFFFDDDTFTADLPRARAIAEKLGTLGITWSCNSRANVPFETLKIMKQNGLRLLLVGYESGNDQILRNIKKGVKTERARQFTRDCKKLGIIIHGTFILGLPVETPETIEQTIRYACELDPDTIQVSLAAPYPGTELYERALAEGWMDKASLVSNAGIQDCALEYPSASRQEIFDAVERMYRRFYFRPRAVVRILRTMMWDSEVRKRRLREGAEFFRFMNERKSPSESAAA
ncbi:MAG TPA: radical SAM protein, partial [Armatimonadota bacterium]